MHPNTGRPAARPTAQAGLADLVRFAAGGAVAGVLAKLADGPVTWLNDAASYLGLWIVAAVVIGATASSAARAAGRAAVAFTAMCLGYYGYAALALGHPVGREAAVWLALALTAVPLVAAAAHAARVRDRWWSGVVLAGLAALVGVGDDAIVRVVIAVTEDPPAAFLASVRPVQAALNVLGAAAVVLLVPRSRRVRWIAVVLTIPVAVLIAPAASAVRSLLGV